MFSADQGHQSISSQSLADFVGVESWQIRKDVSYFGEFGTPGVGYDIEKLAREIKKILRLDTVRRAALIGVGDLGSALWRTPDSEPTGWISSLPLTSIPTRSAARHMASGLKMRPRFRRSKSGISCWRSSRSPGRRRKRRWISWWIAGCEAF